MTPLGLGGRPRARGPARPASRLPPPASSLWRKCRPGGARAARGGEWARPPRRPVPAEAPRPAGHPLRSVGAHLPRGHLRVGSSRDLVRAGGTRARPVRGGPWPG
ncbi:hypothetical protein VULLAG_LOCUS7528 [Vulpes lagopus]